MILDAKAKREASEKLDQQEALLAAIKKREGAMSSRLSALQSSQAKLESSVGKLKGVISGTPEAAAVPTVGASAPGATSANGRAGNRAARAHQQPRFMEVSAEEQAAIGGELETENEQALEAEVDQEAEMQMEAEQAQ